MLKEIIASIRLNISNDIPELNDVQLIYDGADLSEIEKPFATVEYLFDTREQLAAGMRYKEVIYSFQIGVFARDEIDILDLPEKIDEVLSNPEGLTLYTETGVATDTTFICDVSAFTPMHNDDTASDTNNHRGYFDVSVELLTTYGSADFTQ